MPEIIIIRSYSLTKDNRNGRHQVPKENRNIAKFIVQERTQIQNGIINCSLKPKENISN